jgi:hypothetical protein
LVTLSFFFEPLQYVGIDAYRQLLFDRTIEFAAGCAAPVLFNGSGEIGEIDFVLRFGG